MFIYLMTSLSSLSLSLDLAGLNYSFCADLWVLVYLLGVLLVAVYVEPDGCSGAACTAETEDDPRSISKDHPESLRE